MNPLNYQLGKSSQFFGAGTNNQTTQSKVQKSNMKKTLCLKLLHI